MGNPWPFDGPPKRGNFFSYYDKEKKEVISIPLSAPPSVASRVSLEGARVYCKPNGETLDFGIGDVVTVNSAQEKRTELKKRGLMEYQGNIGQKKYNPDSVPSFGEYFHKEHGVSLHEASGLVKGVSDE